MPLMSVRLERALRRCAAWHGEQFRKGSRTPYVQHVFGVATILDRLGFAEDVVIAGLLHDAIEDVPGVTEATIAAEFGPEVASWVAFCSERKQDANGARRPWIDRKTEYLGHLACAPVEARAVALADKLHNLTSILLDLEEGRPVWGLFNAGREQVYWYYEEAVERCGHGDERIRALADECRRLIEAIRSRAEEAPASSPIADD